MLAIVLAFMHDPDLLIMDEPTSGLDPLKQETFLEFVRAERSRGTTFFFSSHVLSEVRKVCDRVGIIRNGHLVTVESVDSLLDRSGKQVRVTLGDSVDPDAFDLPGAHDVTVGGGAGGNEADRDDGVTAVSFTYTGAYEPLLRRLLEHDLRDLSIEEAPLEDVFMRFYDADEPDDAAEVAEDA
jgi:ABC-2 type transport system ATP-binding protein